MRQIYLLTFLFTISLGFSQEPGDIIITEIMQNPDAVSDSNGEYFELYNTTAFDIDIDGWTIKDLGSNSHIINNGGPLNVPAGGYAVLGKNGDTMTNGGVTVDYAFGSGMVLGNSDDEIILETPGALLIDQVNYDGGATFPNPAGASMNLDLSKYDVTDNDSGDNWCDSTLAFGAGDLGNPGSVNETCSILGVDGNQIVSFNVYPNPTSIGYVTIKTQSNEEVSIAVFDVLGKQIINQKLYNEHMDVSNLNTGMYVMRISQNNNTVTKKLVIK